MHTYYTAKIEKMVRFIAKFLKWPYMAFHGQLFSNMANIEHFGHEMASLAILSRKVDTKIDFQTSEKNFQQVLAAST